jgi:hypothetical protein
MRNTAHTGTVTTCMVKTFDGPLFSFVSGHTAYAVS